VTDRQTERDNGKSLTDVA